MNQSFISGHVYRARGGEFPLHFCAIEKGGCLWLRHLTREGDETDIGLWGYMRDLNAPVFGWTMLLHNGEKTASGAPDVTALWLGDLVAPASFDDVASSLDEYRIDAQAEDILEDILEQLEW